MSPTDVVGLFLERVESRDTRAFELVSPDFVQHAAGPQGRDGFRQTTEILDHDLAPSRVEVHHVIPDGELVVVHLTLHGTREYSTMPLLTGVPPTGLPVAWRFMHLFRVADGLIAEHWACRDDVGLLAQVGAWPR